LAAGTAFGDDLVLATLPFVPPDPVVCDDLIAPDWAWE
jgi:hypothetical protein